jgi:hypothetical protein
MLAGLPGEDAKWYLDMAKIIPRLRHLQPPQGNITPIEMHRFAPLYEKRAQFGIDRSAMRPDYNSNFPAGVIDGDKVSYFFQFHCDAIVPHSEYMDPVREALDQWISAHKEKNPPIYEYALGAGLARITDTRMGDGRYLRLADLHHDVMLLCDAIQTRQKLAEDLAAKYPKEIADGTLDRVIEELVIGDVLMAEGNHLLTLPIAHKSRNIEELRSYVLGEHEVSMSQGDETQPAQAGV